MPHEIGEIRSKPLYGNLAHDPTSRWNLLVGEGEGLIGLINFVNSSPAMKSEVTTLMYTGTDVERAYSKSYFNASRCSKVDRHENADALLDALPHVLEESRMGQRICVSGSEAFLWKVNGIAMNVGMHESELCMQMIGSLARRVYCVHCERIDEGVTMDIHECSGCNLALVNVDHFSRRLGAYLGYRVDAEEPGLVPERHELHR